MKLLHEYEEEPRRSTGAADADVESGGDDSDADGDTELQ